MGGCSTQVPDDETREVLGDLAPSAADGHVSLDQVEATPYTLHPTPYTLHPSPHTPHPTPYTLHPSTIIEVGHTHMVLNIPISV